ncbi:receptor-like protein EIX1 [Camellia sinensis]|uniref:receptor-like protein EIX1 n=1 Tax=Camellia sinensis TaxID=4442 RepID=UPI001035D0B2|nr:receptor-like protein EIX1 [Camellia sinensis]
MEPTILSTWGSEEDKKDCWKWRGVGCNNHTSHVTMLDLHVSHNYSLPAYQALRGKISPSLLELQHLKYLDLHGNDFVDIHIPKFIGSLGKLQYLNLACNGFSGPIPNQFRNLSNLQYLNLANNFDLNCGNLDWLFNFSYSLTDVDLSVNQLKGPIPDSFGDMIFLTNLSLYGNYLEEDSLQVLNMDYNQLSGPLPDFTRFSSLKALSVAFNQLSGSIPETFGQHPNLASLMLYGNQNSGSLPNLSTFPSLTHFP